MGFEILLKGNNMIRLLQGVWVALRISLISVVLSMAFGILLGMIMTSKNRIIQAVTRVYLEIVRIMPQLVLLFIVYFGATKAMGINMDALLLSLLHPLHRFLKVFLNQFHFHTVDSVSDILPL